MKPLDDALCVESIKEVMQICGGKWAFVVIGEIHAGTNHFNQICRKTGINTKSLSDVLKKLEANEIIERAVKPTSPVTIEYSLTEKGRDFENIFREMKRWGEKWLAEKS